MVAKKFREKRISTSHYNPATTPGPELGDITEEATPNQLPVDETGTCSSPAGRTSRLQRLLKCELHVYTYMRDVFYDVCPCR